MRFTGTPSQVEPLPHGLNRGGVSEAQHGVPGNPFPVVLTCGAVHLLRNLHTAVGADYKLWPFYHDCGVATEQA